MSRCVRLACTAVSVLLLAAASARAEDTAACVAGGEAWRAGNVQAAIDDFTDCIENGALERKTLADALASRGNILESAGAPTVAMEDFAAALAIDPNHVPALFGRANAYLDLGNLSGALADFDTLIGLVPELAQAYYGRANVKSELGDFEGALADYDRSLAISPGDPFALTNRGWAKLSLGQLEAAIGDFDAAIALNPDHVLAWFNRAWAYYLKGDLQLGLADAEKALVLAPNQVGPIATHAQILAALGRKDEALTGFEQAMTLGGRPLVMTYQQRLAALGYDPGPADGGYGKRTEEALMACIADACRLLQ